MRNYYSCIDASIPAPQPVQHMVIRDRAAKAGGAVVFYGSEDFNSLPGQPFIRLKLSRLRQSGLDGVIFYSVQQFRYGNQFDFKLLGELLDMGLEVIFATEGLTLRSRADLADRFTLLMAVDYTARRDQSESWHKFVGNFDIAHPV